MGDVKRDNRLLFCALALFFFVFLESTLFFQTNLAQPGELGPFFSQLPIQGASTLGLLAFPLKNRLVGEKGRPVFMGGRHRPWGRMPCRRRFRILAAGDRMYGCGRVLPHRACRRHRILGNMRKVARHRAIRNAGRRQPRAWRARANPFARVHIEPPDRSCRAFRRHHRAGRARYAHMDVENSALRPFRMAGRTQGRSR